MRAILLATLTGALVVLLACDKKAGAEAKAQACPTCVTADEHGFHPSSIEVKKGGPGSKETLTFTRTTDKTCAKEVVFPDLNDMKVDLPLNTPTKVEVPADQEKTLTFTCGMGMYKSKVVVR